VSLKINKTKSFVVLLLTALVCFPPRTGAQDYLPAEELGAIAAASVGILYFGETSQNNSDTRKSLIHGPILFDKALQKFLGGKCSEGKTNFLDNSYGAVVTPAIAGTILLAADLSWPQNGDKGKFVGQDMFLYTTGIIATKGVTGLAKGIVSRQRPLPCLEPGIAELREDINYAYDHSSFFSGHVSGAFFATTFLNKRLRSIMRHELTPDDYDSWSWAPPALLFSWASVVGWSRIHAYKHFFTDIAAGALAGFLMAELFYSFNNYDIAASPKSAAFGANKIIYVRFTF